MTLPLANAAEGKGLSKLWARRMITDAEIARTRGRLSADQSDRATVTLALEHQLVTRLTSLVAVDKTPSRPEGAVLKVTDLPLNLPAGWDFEKVFGERQKLLTPPLERRADAGDARPVRAISRSAAPAASAPAAAVGLPQTATNAELEMISGSVLLMLGLLLVLYRRDLLQVDTK